MMIYRAGKDRKNFLFSPKPIYAFARPCYNCLANHSAAAKCHAISMLGCFPPIYHGTCVRRCTPCELSRMPSKALPLHFVSEFPVVSRRLARLGSMRFFVEAFSGASACRSISFFVRQRIGDQS